VELITNGTLLTLEMSNRLLEAGLDMLWVSLDGRPPESYADVRLDRPCRMFSTNISPTGGPADGIHQRAYLGIVFVAMKRNIADLRPLETGQRMGADDSWSVTFCPTRQK